MERSLHLQFDSTGTAIESLTESTDEPNAEFERQFAAFIRQHDPQGVTVAPCCSWDSAADARDVALRRVELGETWARFLAANGCTYRTCHGLTIDQLFARTDGFFAAYRSEDAAAVAGLLQPGGPIAAIAEESVFVAMAWDAVLELERTPPLCSAVPTDGSRGSGPDANAVFFVHCNVVEVRHLERSVGAPGVEVEFRFGFNENGLLETVFFTAPFPGWDPTIVPFRRWLLKTYPEAGDLPLPAPDIGTPVEEAVRDAHRFARYASEWAEYLRANQCSYSEACPP